jgi:hypothetical protein
VVQVSRGAVAAAVCIQTVKTRDVPELRRVEEPQSRMIDDAALQVGVVVVRLEHEEFSTASPVHRVARFGRECETLYKDKTRQQSKTFLVNKRMDLVTRINNDAVPLNLRSMRRRRCCS